MASHYGVSFMRSIFLILVCLLSTVPAHATTYNYVGTPGVYSVTYNEGCTSQCELNSPILIGSISFGFDTAHFTGIHVLTATDTGFIIGSDLIGPISAFSVPESYSWFNPPFDSYGIYSQVTGSFDFLNGKIEDWSISGEIGLVGCGAGPGCSFGAGFTSSSSSAGDHLSAYSYPSMYILQSNGGGAWTEVASPVPELPSWTMLLFGLFALGLGRRLIFTDVSTRSPTLAT